MRKRRPGGLKFTQAQVRMIVALYCQPRPAVRLLESEGLARGTGQATRKFLKIDRRFPYA